jgi:hypothetical protein
MNPAAMLTDNEIEAIKNSLSWYNTIIKFNVHIKKTTWII